MNKLVCYLLLLPLLLLAAACGPTATPQPTEPAASDDVPLTIGLAIGVAGVEDGGFNELSLAGVSSASRRLGADFEYQVAEAESAPLVTAMAESGEYDILVTVGFEMLDITREMAEAHPDIHFIGIDQFQETEIPNVTGITFPDDQAGFLAGVLAANLTETNTVAGVYGPDEVMPIQAFAAGYENGVAYVDENIEVLTQFHPEGVDVGFADVEWGAATASEQLAAGADVIFTAAGDTGRGALIEVAQAREDTEDPLYCIGVDTDQWQTAPQARPCLVSSAVKSIPVAVDEVIAQVAEGNPPAGNYLGPVGLAPFHDFDDIISEELAAELDQLAADLTSGAVSTGVES